MVPPIMAPWLLYGLNQLLYSSKDFREDLLATALSKNCQARPPPWV